MDISKTMTVIRCSLVAGEDFQAFLANIFLGMGRGYENKRGGRETISGHFGQRASYQG